MTIRNWKYEDILRISQIEEECFPGEPWTFKMLASSFESETFFGVIAEDDGEIAGYGGITVAADTADIGNVAVTEPYRRSGVATAVLDKLVSIAAEKGAEKVFLEVRVSNSPAMSLYLKSGFKGAYARTRYYPDGEDCLVMVRTVKE